MIRQFQIAAIVLIPIFLNSVGSAQVTPKKNQASEASRKASAIHPNAHAHNDYYHKRPLLDALENGFCSVEADILLVDGKLRVAHSYFESNEEKTLERLYLEPLVQRVRKNKGSVHGKKSPFRLLIDIKTDAERTFRVLDKQLKKYPETFSHYKDGEWNQRAVLVIVSGNRPKETIQKQAYRIAMIDGRLSDLGKGHDPVVMPLISDRWGSHFKWRGRGPISKEEKAKLKRLVKRTHDEKKILRFWAIPDRPEAWSLMKKVGVDLINTDKLEKLNQFLSKEKQPETKKL